MSTHKPGDRVHIPATVVWDVDPDGEHLVVTAWNLRFYVPAAVLESALEPYVDPELESAPEVPYVEPEVVPGMVVMSKDRSDDRVWFVIEGKASGGPFFMPPAHGMINGCYRHGLPEKIRPVFDPRKETP